MAKILIDIGAHTGESLEESLRSIYSFDSILVVEPSSKCIPLLFKFKDKRISIYQFAVSNYDGWNTLYGAGSVGGSLFGDKKQYWKTLEIVKVVKLFEFIMACSKPGDDLYIKVNIEGSEIHIIEELKLIKNRQIISILLSIDVDKVPSLKKHKSKFQKTINKTPFPIVVRNEKNNQLAVRNWLIKTDILIPISRLKKIIDSCRLFLPLQRNLLRIIKLYVPKKIWLYIALRFGPNHAR